MVAHKQGALRGATEACMCSARAQYTVRFPAECYRFYLVTLGGAELV